MKVSVIGTGRMGQGLVGVLAQTLSHVIWGSRSEEKVRGLVEERRFANVTPVDQQTALQADIIIHALWFRDLLPWAKEREEELAGKIVVDIVNPFTEDFNDFTTEWGTSAAEQLQELLPQTQVVGAFKNTFFKVFDNPLHEGLASDVYVTSDHEQAKQTVLRLFENLPFRIWDGGKLKNNRTIERMTLFEREMALRYGHYPYVSFRLFGISDPKSE